MIAMLEEDWGVSDQGDSEYKAPEYPERQSWWDKLRDVLGL